MNAVFDVCVDFHPIPIEEERRRAAVVVIVVRTPSRRRQRERRRNTDMYTIIAHNPFAIERERERGRKKKGKQYKKTIGRWEKKRSRGNNTTTDEPTRLESARTDITQHFLYKIMLYSTFSHVS